MTNWLTPQRLEDYAHRFDHTAEGLVINLGHCKEATSFSDEAEDVEEVLFDGEVLCEEYSTDLDATDYRPIDQLAIAAIFKRARFELDERLLTGGGMKRD